MPFVRFVLFLILGITTQIKLSVNFDILLYVCLISIPVWFFLQKLIQESYKNRYINGVIAFIIIFIFGAAITSFNTAKELKFKNEKVIATAIINEQIEEKEKTFKTVLKLQKHSNDSTNIKDNSLVIVYFEKDSIVPTLKYGDEIIFKSRISEISKPGNPNEFNYRNYLFRKGIVGQVYLKSGSWKITNNDKGKLLYNLAYSMRQSLLDIYRNHSIKGEEFAVLSALTLGYKDELKQETKQAFVTSGAMHVLAVSGLHVGIIYGVLSFIFAFLNKFKYRKFNYGKILKAIIIIVFLCFFAMISGLSPSVCRAVIMFIFIIIASLLNRPNNIYNSLSASAFILLIYNPFYITEVGFQLSYLAVFSIVYFQPKLVNLIKIKNKYLNMAWALTCVAFAAQIGTAPIAIYYFNVFPVWFFLSNIFVIVLATFIFYFAAGLFVVSAFSSISHYIALVLNYLVKALNYSVKSIQKLPFSIIENIYLSVYELFLVYLFIITVSVFIVYKRVKFLHLSLTLISIFIIITCINTYESSTRKGFYIYNVNNETVLNFITANQNCILADSSVLQNNKLKYSAQQNFLMLQKPDYEFIDINDSCIIKDDLFYKKRNMISFTDKKILILNSKSQIKYINSKKQKLDYIIISKNINIFIKDILELYNPELIIFDSSNKYYRIEKWFEECEELKQKYYSVPNKGAFSVNF